VGGKGLEFQSENLIGTQVSEQKEKSWGTGKSG